MLPGAVIELAEDMDGPAVHPHTNPAILTTNIWWIINATANGVTLVAYTAIAVAILSGLAKSKQWRRNLLGLATAAIFITCAVHHGSHTVHMLLPIFGIEVDSGTAMRVAVGHNFRMAAWDTLTAAVGVWYWGLRGRFPTLVKGAALFDDLKLREASEHALRTSEDRYRRIVETTSEGVLTLDADMNITFANQRLAEMLGYSVDDLVGLHATGIAVPDEHAAVNARLRRRRKGAAEQYATRLQHRDGHLLHVNVSGTPLYTDEGEFDGSLALITDVTEQRNLETQFRQAQKLEAVGQLAGGVAHDFNNLLTVIDGYAAILLDEAPPSARADLEAIRAAAARAHGLTRQLLAFSRTQVTRPRDVDLNEVVNGVRDMLSRLIGEDIRLITQLTTRTAYVHVDQGQYEQVLVNLVVNARDAMPDGGTLTLTTEVTRFDTNHADQPNQAGMEPGEYAVLAVADTGVGMTAEIQSRVFEPFYTTKAPGKGTGLGLSTTYGIIHDAGGRVTIDSQPGQGSTFRIYLPLVSPPTDAPVGGPVVDQEVIAGHGETVLLVEDEPSVRELASRITRAAGYQLLSAANAEQALQIAEKTERLDLLLTDVVMPGLNGRELAERLVSARPTLRVLFTSAHAHGIIADRGILHQNVKYLEKPYTPAQLTLAIRDVLDAPATPAHDSEAAAHPHHR